MKTFVWSITSRILHWLLAISFVGAYFLGGEENNLALHITFGLTLFITVIMRIIWGAIGPKYSKFTDFPVSPSSIINHLKNIKNSKNLYLGHNPLASIVMIAILVFGLLAAVTGMTIVAKDGNGFAFFAGLPGSEDFFEEIHEVITNLFMVLVVFHLLGLIADKILHKNQSAILSMFTGYKNIEGESIKLNGFQSGFSAIALLIIFGIFGYNLMNPLPIKEKEKSEMNGKSESNENHEKKEKDHKDKDDD
jgi:cytochrome b